MADVTFSTDTDDDGTGTTGTIHNNAWKQAMAIAVNDGFVWITPSFSAGNYLGDGAMTVTVAAGDVTNHRYVYVNECLFWTLTLATISIGGTPSPSVLIKVPGTRTLSSAGYARVDYCNDNGTIRDNAIIQTYGSDPTHIAISFTSGANWTASTNGTYIYFSIVMPVAT